jgi:transposase
MRPVFKKYNQGQMTLFPMSLDDKIPKNSPVRLVNEIVDQLDINNIIKMYKGNGASSYCPRMMLKVVIYAYLCNIYSCRKIENALLDHVTFMWLAAGQEPDYNTINRFRSKKLKNTINWVFTRVVTMLVEMGYLTLEIAYVDGTKIESRANRYTFVWRKTREKDRAKLDAKIRKVLEYIDEGIASDNLPDNEPPTPIDPEELKKRIAETNRKNRTKAEQKETEESKSITI